MALSERSDLVIQKSVDHCLKNSHLDPFGAIPHVQTQAGSSQPQSSTKMETAMECAPFQLVLVPCPIDEPKDIPTETRRSADGGPAR